MLETIAPWCILTKCSIGFESICLTESGQWSVCYKGQVNVMAQMLWLGNVFWRVTVNAGVP